MFVLTEPTRQKPVLSVLWRNACGQRRDLDRVAEMGAGAVALDILDRIRVNAGEAVRLDDRRGLPVDARREVAGLAAAVVVDRGGLDDGLDRIAVGERIAEPPQHDDPDAAAENGAGGAMVEGAAMPVGREDLALLVEIAAPMRQLDRRRRRRAPCRTRRSAGSGRRSARRRARSSTRSGR